MLRKIEDETYFIKFSSLNEFLQSTGKDAVYSDAHSSNKSSIEDLIADSYNNWRFGTEKSLDVYYDKRFNPEKGKNLCKKNLDKVLSSKDYKDSLKLALTYKKKINFLDVGHKIDVSRAISGDDKYFKTSKLQKKFSVKIAINVAVSAMCDDNDLMKIASTAIPIIYALEQAGICTEVWLVAFSENTYSTYDFKYTAIEICLKTAQERFSWTTFAPVFQTGSFRHSIFLTYYNSSYETYSHLGKPLDKKDLSKKDNYGYAVIIGANAPGPVTIINEIFNKIKK